MHRHHRRLAVAVVGAVVALGLVGCSDRTPGAASTSTTTTAPPKAAEPPVELASLGVDTATVGRCNPIGRRCMVPLPDDVFTVADPATPTGRRLHLDAASLPANTAGVHVDPTDQNRADGWSPGSTIMVDLGAVDLAASQAPSLADLSASLAERSPIVVLDATTGRRHPFWAEMDAKAEGEPLVLVHPARNFPDGHRIVVGVRHLVGAGGATVEAERGFAAYRDGQRTTAPAFEQHRAAMERTFADLGRAGVARSDLQLAWDFTVASTKSLTGRMTAIRDDAFAVLGDAAPRHTVTVVTERPEPRVRRRVEGTFEVPLYLTQGGAPGGSFVLDASGVPTRQPGTFTASFRCNVPESPFAATRPARMVLYGHGLLGSRDEIDSDMALDMGVRGSIVDCATDWYGLAEGDVGNAVAALADLSSFHTVADRLQQGMLAFLFLGRLMRKGFGGDAALRIPDRPPMNTDELYFDGNSQGAIVGGALTAVAQDFTRSVLGEAGMNYSLLLDRSVDFDEYLHGVFEPNYPDRVDRLVALAVIQLLWDRGEADGYANHMTDDPLEHTPAHTVLLLGAVGDHQVSEYSLRVEARTIGARAHLPLAAAGRTAERDPGWSIPAIERFPHAGTAYFLWDTGSPATPVPNTAASSGHDPHDDTPNIPAVQELKDAFWHPDGAVPDVCRGGPCTAPVPPQNA